jgi:hypothetical protein
MTFFQEVLEVKDKDYLCVLFVLHFLVVENQINGRRYAKFLKIWHISDA